MLRSLLATFAAALVVVLTPAALAPALPGLPLAGVVAYAADADDADADEKKKPGKKKRVPHNKKVGLNLNTMVYHAKTCRHFNDKLKVMSVKDAKGKGGKPCKICL